MLDSASDPIRFGLDRLTDALRTGAPVPGVSLEVDAALRKRLVVPTDRRIWDLFRALNRGWSVEQLYDCTKIDPWFLRQIRFLVDEEGEMTKRAGQLASVPAAQLRDWKRHGFSDL